ncbi:MAG TPA: hypothetical protein VGS99_09020, partial [Gammaproteobacteria bacterium]|nr:hypothetical protein [Gammaproteobacteria bacterium]
MKLSYVSLATFLLTIIFSLPAPAADDGVSVALHKLFAREWQRTLREDPVYCSDLGDCPYND